MGRGGHRQPSSDATLCTSAAPVEAPGGGLEDSRSAGCRRESVGPRGMQFSHLPASRKKGAIRIGRIARSRPAADLKSCIQMTRQYTVSVLR